MLQLFRESDRGTAGDGREDGLPPLVAIAAVAAAGDADERMADFGAEAAAELLIPS